MVPPPQRFIEASVPVTLIFGCSLPWGSPSTVWQCSPVGEGVWAQATSSSPLHLCLLPKFSYCKDQGLNTAESTDQSRSIRVGGRVPQQAMRSQLKSLPLSPLPSRHE